MMMRSFAPVLLFAAAALGAACSSAPTIDPPEEPLGVVQSALTQKLPEYANACDAAIGVTVPDFDCESGTIIPTTNLADGRCDRPNRLNRECDPDSRLKVLTNDANAYVVALCRKKGNAAGMYGDIAVIQHNKKNGSTCFYQSHVNGTALSGQVTAPSKGNTSFWLTPAATAGIRCGGCHDNGPLVRSPYLTQVTGPDALPGTGSSNFNQDQPYKFVGADFASWKVFKVEIDGNMCLGCHRMATNNLPPQFGAALDFGVRATSKSEVAKNPHSETSPIWMKPGQNIFQADSFNAARAIQACALRRNENPLPNAPDCRITQYNAAAPANIPGDFTAVFRPGPGGEGEIQIYGATLAKYLEKYSQIESQGWRLFSLQPYVINGNVKYNAVWRPGTQPELRIYDKSKTELLDYYDTIKGAGWRFKILEPYTVGVSIRYSAVFEQTSELQMQVMETDYDGFRNVYDALYAGGMRLKLIQPHDFMGVVLYTAVFAPSTVSEVQVYSWKYDDFRAKYDELWPLGWRLAMLRRFMHDGSARYTAVWRPSTDDEIQVYGKSYAEYRERYDELWEQGWRLKILRTTDDP